MATKSTVFFIVLCAYVRYVLAYTGQEEIADVALRLKKAGYISLKQMIKALIQNMVDSRQFINKQKESISSLEDKIDILNKDIRYRDAALKQAKLTIDMFRTNYEYIKEHNDLLVKDSFELCEEYECMEDHDK